MTVGYCNVVYVSVNGQNPVCGESPPSPVDIPGGFDPNGFFNGDVAGPEGLVTISPDNQTAEFNLGTTEYEDGLALRGLTGITPRGRRSVEFALDLPAGFSDSFGIGLATNGATYNGRVPIDDTANNNVVTVSIPTVEVDTPISTIPGFPAGGDIANSSTSLLGDLAGGFIFRGAICIVRATSGFHRTFMFDLEDFRNITGSASASLENIFGVSDPWPGAIDNVYWYQPDNELIVTANSQIYVMDLDNILAGWVASQPFATAPSSVARDPVSGNWVVSDNVNQDVTIYDSSFTELQRFTELAGGAVNIGFYTSPTGGNDWVILNISGTPGSNIFYNRLDFMAGTLTNESSTPDATALNANSFFGGLSIIDSDKRMAYDYFVNNLRVVAMEDTSITPIGESETQRRFNFSFDYPSNFIYLRDNLGGFVRVFWGFDPTDIIYPFVFITDNANGEVFSVTLTQEVERMNLQQWAGSVDYLAPEVVPIDLPQLSARWVHNLYTDLDGNVIGWGNNSSGQITIPALPPIVQVATGGNSSVNAFSLALDENGVIHGWGDDNNGILSNIPDTDTYVFISASDTFAFAITDGGAIVGWGNNQDNVINNIPALTDAIAVYGGFGHAVALRSNGQVLCWGRNVSGQASVPSYVDHCVDIAAYWEGSAAVTKNGKLITWGISNNYGQGTTDKRYLKVAAGRYNAIGLLENGAIEVIGNNEQSQIDVPAIVEGLNVVGIGCGFSGWYTVLTDTSCLVGWGSDTDGTATPPIEQTCTV